MTGNKKGKSNMDKYLDAEKDYETFTDKIYESGKSPTTAQLLKINALSEKVEQLKLVKDIPILSTTCKKRLVQIYTEETTGRKKDIESVYIEKGLRTEEQSITTYSLWANAMYFKNKERIGNGYVIGEIDFDDEEKDMVIDTKSSFDIFSFDATVAQKINPLYEWQGQMYMWLKNRSRFRLAYCLNNTPEDIIIGLIKRMRYNFAGTEDDWQEAVALLRDKHTYDDLPLERKIRVYDIKRDDEKIELAKKMIPHFRNYLKNIKTQEDDFED